jgi:hypothetical protein
VHSGGPLAWRAARQQDHGVAGLQQQHHRQQQITEFADRPLHQGRIPLRLAQRAHRLVGAELALDMLPLQQRRDRALACPW